MRSFIALNSTQLNTTRSCVLVRTMVANDLSQPGLSAQPTILTFIGLGNIALVKVAEINFTPRYLYKYHFIYISYVFK